MTQIAWFSTDFTAERIPDPIKSAQTGKEEFVEGQQRLTHGGTFLQRGAMPAFEMSKHGWDCHISWQFRVAPDGHIQTIDPQGNWNDPEIFYSQRWMSQDGVDQVRRAQATGQKCVADLDDDFWALGKTNIAYHTTDPKKNPSFNRDHYWNMIAACDAITVSTEALRKRVEPLGKPTYVLRNAIDLDRWPQNDPGADGMIGWCGGIQWRSHDLAQLKCANIEQFLIAHQLPIYHGGHSEVPGVPTFYEQMGIDPTRVKYCVSPLVHVADYPNLWAPINISLVPLEKVPFNAAKSWLKALESCAVGVPYIVSAGFHEQDLLIAEGSAGRVARNDKPRQWIEHLEALLDPDVRREEGKINRSIAEKHDIKERWVEWDAAYKEIAAL